MPKTYKATGINLKGMPLGESDRLLTVLTREQGLIRVVAPKARTHLSRLGGRSEVFVVNHLLLSSSRSLDKIVQAETIESFPGLSQDLKKLTAGQYLAELVLGQALSDQPQEDLFDLMLRHLKHIELLPGELAIAALTYGTFHLLTLAGLTPQVHHCCMTQSPIYPAVEQPNWQIGFSPAAGGVVTVEASRSIQGDLPPDDAGTKRLGSRLPVRRTERPRTAEAPMNYGRRRASSPTLTLGALELAVLQQLGQAIAIHSDGRLHLMSPEVVYDQRSIGDLCHPGDLLPTPLSAALSAPIPLHTWLAIERVLRHYAQYHFERPIHSAALIDSCFAPPLP